MCPCVKIKYNFCLLFHALCQLFGVEPYVDFYKETDHNSFSKFSKFSKLTVKTRYARTNVLKYNYFHRVAGTWNSLPLSPL